MFTKPYRFYRGSVFVTVSLPISWIELPPADVWSKLVSSSVGLLPPPYGSTKTRMVKRIGRMQWKKICLDTVIQVQRFLGGNPDF